MTHRPITLCLGAVVVVSAVAISMFNGRARLARSNTRAFTLGNLSFPNGPRVSIGSIGKPSSTSPTVKFTIPVHNQGISPLDLGSIRIATPCCTPARIVSGGVVQPGHTGEIICSAMLPCTRVGPSAFRVPLVLADSMSTSQVFEILVDYLVDEGTIVAWGSSSIHLGSLCSGTPTVSRDFELTIQPYDEKHKEWKPLVKSDTSAVRAEIFTHKRVNTSSGQDASVFTVRVFADPSQLPPKGSAVLRVDDLDVAPISVTWIAVPELQRAPVNKLLFLEQSPTAQVRTLVFWNNLHSKMEIVSTRHSGRNLSIEVDSQPHPQYVQRLRVEARPEFGASDAGIIEVLIRTAGRQDRTELVPVSTILAN